MNLFNTRVACIIAIAFCATLFVGAIPNVFANAASTQPTTRDSGAEKTKIDVDKLPKSVVMSVKKQMPGAKITKASKFEEDGNMTYYLDDVKIGKKGWDLTVAEDGKIIKKEECHDED